MSKEKEKIVREYTWLPKTRETHRIYIHKPLNIRERRHVSSVINLENMAISATKAR